MVISIFKTIHYSVEIKININNLMGVKFLPPLNPLDLVDEHKGE